jgi:hypothetical protein
MVEDKASSGPDLMVRKFQNRQEGVSFPAWKAWIRSSERKVNSA